VPSPGPCLATIVVNSQKSSCKQPLFNQSSCLFFWRISYTICVTVIITLLQIQLVIPIIFARFHTESLKDSLQKCPHMAMTRPQSHSTQLCLVLKQKLNPRSVSYGHKQVLATVSRKHGGVQHASSPCELPRNERQVSYIQTRKKASRVPSLGDAIDPLADQVLAMMQSASLGDSLGLFVRETRPSPEPAFILARDRQLDDLVRFCAIANGFSVLTVDPTFKLGDFDVTPITYRHRLLERTQS